MNNFKLSIIAFLILFCQGALAAGPLPFRCLSFKHQSLTDGELNQALGQAAAQIRNSQPDLAASVGFGRCLNLPETSVLAVANQKLMDFPEECLGLTFLAFSKTDMIDKALKTLQTKNTLIDGVNGAAFVIIRGKKLKVPICMESFEGGGPQ